MLSLQRPLNYCKHGASHFNHILISGIFPDVCFNIREDFQSLNYPLNTPHNLISQVSHHSEQIKTIMFRSDLYSCRDIMCFDSTFSIFI